MSFWESDMLLLPPGTIAGESVLFSGRICVDRGIIIIIIIIRRVAQAPSDVRDQGVLNATVYPPQCPQGSSATPLETTDDEDCLFLDVYVPSGSTPQSTLPVLVVRLCLSFASRNTGLTDEMLPQWIHGGGWDHNSVQQFDPTPMINYANNSFIGVSLDWCLTHHRAYVPL